MKSDNELRKNFKIFIDENDIINLVVFGVEKDSRGSLRAMEIIADSIYKILNKNPGKIYNLLTDTTPAGEVWGHGFSTKTREKAVQFISSKQLGKLAVLTKGPYMSLVFNFILEAAGKKRWSEVFFPKKKRPWNGLKYSRFRNGHYL